MRSGVAHVSVWCPLGKSATCECEASSVDCVHCIAVWGFGRLHACQSFRASGSVKLGQPRSNAAGKKRFPGQLGPLLLLLCVCLSLLPLLAFPSSLSFCLFFSACFRAAFVGPLVGVWVSLCKLASPAEICKEAAGASQAAQHVADVAPKPQPQTLSPDHKPRHRSSRQGGWCPTSCSACR